MKNYIDLVGQRFGRWTVKLLDSIDNGHAKWLCKCECGNERVVASHSLRKGKSSSCGCLQREIAKHSLERNSRNSPAPDLTNKRFKRWLVIGKAEKSKHGMTQWLCRCDCGNERDVLAMTLLNGRSSSCGCIQREIAAERCKRKLVRSKWDGRNSPRWQGGIRKTKQGYVMEWSPGHPRAQKGGNYVLQHVLVMERMIGRSLSVEETVHHKNGIRHDNRPENLELWTKSHPPGQRIADMVEFSLSILKKYAPDKLNIS